MTPDSDNPLSETKIILAIRRKSNVHELQWFMFIGICESTIAETLFYIEHFTFLQ